MLHGRPVTLAAGLLFLTACGPSNDDSGPAPSVGGKAVGGNAVSAEIPASGERDSRALMPEDDDLVEGVMVEITRRAGLEFVHETGGSGGFHMPEVISGGAAIFDFDGDGRLDLYLVNGGSDAARPTERGGIVNQLYRNLDGEHFERVAGAAGAEGQAYGMGVAVGDANGDGKPDLYLTNLGPDELLLNAGDGSFRTESAKGAAGWSCSAGFLDYDADGELDVFIARYVVFDAAGSCFDSADRPEYCGPKSFTPQSDILLKGDGEGGLVDVSKATGIFDVAAAGLGVAIDDFDEDGWTDVYVANDAYANNLWVNQRDGTLVDDALILGAAFNMNGQAEAGMGVVAGDLDDDGHVDLFMTHLISETNTYYRSLGPGIGFVDGTGRSGLAQTSMAFTGFGIALFDLELDGDQDLFVANGRVKKGEVLSDTRMPEPWDRYAEPNLFYLNVGKGRYRFANEMVPAMSDRAEISRSAALGDIDGDGDLDLVLVNAQGPARLYRNESDREGRGLFLELLDGRRSALGAQLRLVVGEFERVRTVAGCAGFQSGSDARVHIGLPFRIGETSGKVEVRWVGGQMESFELNQLEGSVTLVRGEGEELP